MKLYLLRGTDPTDEVNLVKSWIVIAESEDEARALVPSDFDVEEVEEHTGKLEGPARSMGWIGAVRYLGQG